MATSAADDPIGISVDRLVESRDLRETLLNVMSRLAHVGGWRNCFLEHRFIVTEEFACICGFDIEDTPEDALLDGSFFDTESQERLAAARREAIETERPYDVEVSFTAPSGERRWVRSMGTPIIEDGQVVRLEGAITDVTERHAAEAQARKLSERMQLAAKAAGLGVWDWDLKAGDLYWDDRMYELYGLERDEFKVTGTSWLERVHPDDRLATAESLENAIATGEPFDVQFRVVYPDGEIHYIKTYSEVSRDTSGEPLRLTGVNHDITVRHETEREAEELSERLQLAAKSAGLGVWDWDLKAGDLYWDDRMYELYGLERDEFKVTGTSWLERVHPDDRYATAESLEIAIATGQPFDVAYRVVYPNGDIHYLKTYSEVSRDEAGQPLRLTGVNHDITDLKGAEIEIRELNATLEKRVEQRTIEVTAANKELEAFAYAVSHDLRAPLRAMTGFCRALEEDYGTQLDETALMYTQHISTAAKSMGELIEGILVLSRATRGDIERTEIDISAMAAGAIERCRVTDPEHDAEVVIEPEMTVVGDARMIEAMLSNLISNAWKYSGGTEGARIDIFSEERYGRRWICVKDNGAGFDPAYAAQLFEPFRRLHRQDEFPGIGIGLATVQRIINRHGGEIEAEGAPGEGATFRFWLPE